MKRNLGRILACFLLLSILASALTVVGKVVVAAPGTPQALATSSRPASVVLVCAEPGNTQYVYVGDSSLVKATGAGQAAKISAGQCFTAPYGGGNRHDLSKIYIDADNGTDAVDVSYEVQ